jgi:E3 ubiquitin-protein ligase RAD18
MSYNANLDKSLANRKTKVELRKDLKKWEQEKVKKKRTIITDVKGYQVRAFTHASPTSTDLSA